jgi:hypothetical protein
MEAIEAAILRTVLYADVFHFPLTAAEIHHFLIWGEPAEEDAVENWLANSPLLRQKLAYEGEYVALRGREDLIPLRAARDTASRELWPLALRYGRWLSCLPFVRMVALTGALAMRNPTDAHDDLDYLLVTAPRRVWLARAFSIILVRLARLQGVEICPNYVLAESNLTQERQDIFIAHEVSQMVPLYGHSHYWRLRNCNPWVSEHLSNANGIFHAEEERPFGRGWLLLKSLLETVLGGAIGNRLENWEYRRKLRRFARQMQTPYSSARLDPNQVKGHFNDHGHFVLQQYAERLREHGLEQQPAAVPGD